MTDPLGHLAAHDLLAGVDNQSRLVSELDRQLNYSARHSRVAPAVNGPARLDANPYTASDTLNGFGPWRYPGLSAPAGPVCCASRPD